MNQCTECWWIGEGDCPKHGNIFTYKLSEEELSEMKALDFVLCKCGWNGQKRWLKAGLCPDCKGKVKSIRDDKNT